MEKKIFDIAMQQAANDSKKQHLEDMNKKLASGMKEKDERLSQLRQREAALKAEIRDMKSKTQRSVVDMEYVKNVVVKYMVLHNSIGQEQLVPLIGNLLEFTPEDARSVREAHEVT